MPEFQEKPSAETLSNKFAGGATAEPLGNRELTFGERLVGLNFNPANDDKVYRAKRLCADLADLMHDDFNSRPQSRLAAVLHEHTAGQILNAQMNVVKILTLKY